MAWRLSVVALVATVADSLARRSDYYPSWHAYLPLAVASFAVALALGVPTLGRRDGPVLSLRLFALLGVLWSALDLAFMVQPAGSADYSPLNYALMASALIAGFAFRTAPGLLVVGVSLALRTIERGGVVGYLQASAETLTDLSLFLLPFVVLALFTARVNESAILAAELADASAVAETGEATVEGQSYFDRLLHDKVLGALRCAVDGNSAGAASLASEALVSFDALDLPRNAPYRSDSVDAVAIVTDHARRVGVALTVVPIHDPWPSGEPGRALRIASNEALSNVARHTPGRRATLSATRIGDSYRVEITDDGPGFDPGSVPGEHRGLELSLRLPIESIGGQVSFTRGPGGGTLIAITVPTGLHATGSPARTTWTRWWSGTVARDSLIAMWPILALSTLGFEITAILYRSDAVSPLVTMLGMAVIIVVPLALHRFQHSDRWLLALTAVTVIVWAAEFWNIADPSVADWRLWFVGSFNITLGFLTVYRGRAWALTTFGATALLGFSALALRGVHFLPAVVSCYQSLLVILMVSWIMRQLTGAANLIVEQRLRYEDVSKAAERASMIQAEIVRRQRGLEPGVVPMLRELAAKHPLDEERRWRCAELMRATRDELVASTLLTPELVAAIAEARGRGATVTIVGTCDPSHAAPLDDFRHAALLLLRAARRGDVLTLRWGPYLTEYATAVLTGEGADTIAPSNPWPAATEIDSSAIYIAVPRQVHEPAPVEVKR